MNDQAGRLIKELGTSYSNQKTKHFLAPHSSSVKLTSALLYISWMGLGSFTLYVIDTGNYIPPARSQSSWLLLCFVNNERAVRLFMTINAGICIPPARSLCILICQYCPLTGRHLNREVDSAYKLLNMGWVFHWVGLIANMWSAEAMS